MALGLARMFGIKLPVNFNSPYQALSIVDFWRRWHITLSSFLRDYLYIPFGGSRYGKPRQYISLMTTMLLGGLWHGASWTFVFWGFLHGFYLTINHAWSALIQDSTISEYLPKSVTAAIAHITTMLAVMFAWVFFRAENFQDAIIIIEGMLGQTQFYSPKIWSSVIADTSFIWLQIMALCIIVTYFPNSIELTRKYRPALQIKTVLRKAVGLSALFKNNLIWRPTISWSFFIVILTSMSLMFLYQSNNLTEFIYFNF